MKSSYEPLRKRERRELEGHVGGAAIVGRALLSLLAVGAVALLSRFGFAIASAGTERFQHPIWWIAPAILAAGVLYLRARMGTGVEERRARIKEDLDRGDAAVHTVHALEAIIVEQHHDEGPTVFVQTELAGVIRFSGRYLEPLVEQGFPWSEITIREAPESRVFFGVTGKPAGEVPTRTRSPFTQMEETKLGAKGEPYLRLRTDFATVEATLGFKRS